MAESYFQILQIIFAILVVILILLQQQGSGLGSAFGGEGNYYRSKRGLEKVFFYLTSINSTFCGFSDRTLIFELISRGENV